ETAVALLNGKGEVLASEIASQIDIHRVYGGVVPEVASRNHLLKMRPVLLKALEQAQLALADIDVFAATAGPGLAGALLIGNTTAKTLALAHGKPFVSVNHLEGHLLSPFMGQAQGIQPCVALVVSGGHTMLIHLKDFSDYQLCGKTRDDAAGEAFDKVAKMIGLPYPGGPEVDRCAKQGNRKAYDFPRSMLITKDHDFSFSGLKTSVLYMLDKLDRPLDDCRADLCASFQEAVMDILIGKTIRLAQQLGEKLITVSGGVSGNSRLREAFQKRLQEAGLQLLIAPAALTTDNAAMIAYVAWQKAQRGDYSPLEEDVNPNLRLAERN
ncbi:MAG: tRNA (adenosine(37)-N6)-threonylcarbamoyltransferase complex transferase subunit TsaD, partial [Verrucomicrobiales bacterium]